MKKKLILLIILIYQLNSFAQFSSQKIIATEGNTVSLWSISAADLDGDGDMDILSASSGYPDGNISWYENTDGLGTFGPQQILTAYAREATSVYAADLDGDNDMDILFASAGNSPELGWLENTDGQGNFGDEQVIIYENGALSVYSTDIDGDGDMDVLSAINSIYSKKITWHENIDGLGNFGSQQIISASDNDDPWSVFAADLDGDNDIDVLSVHLRKITWYKNIDGKGDFGPQQIITTEVVEARSVCANDIDGDGDLDILSASYGKIAWYENIDGLGTFGEQQVIENIEYGRSIYTADIDKDGDLDVISATSNYSIPDIIAWHQNIDGRGNFAPQQVITTNIDGANSVYAIDLNGDGYKDVISGSRNDNKIAWYENEFINNSDIDEDGILNEDDYCPNTPKDETADSNGCSESQLDDDGDGIMNDKDRCPNTQINTIVDSNGCFTLPSNNFTIEVLSETCPNKNNGQISISAFEIHSYVASVNGASYNFDNNKLIIPNLQPNSYDVCITVSNKNFEQCYTIIVAEAKTISGKISMASKKVLIDIKQGTAPYKVLVNGNITLKTLSPSFSLDVKHGDLVEVKTDRDCEGTFSKTIDLFEGILVYPNPTNGSFEITLSSSIKNVVIELYSINTQLISKKSYPVINGKVKLNIENKSEGLYFLKIYLDKTVYLKIIKE